MGSWELPELDLESSLHGLQRDVHAAMGSWELLALVQQLLHGPQRDALAVMGSWEVLGLVRQLLRGLQRDVHAAMGSWELLALVRQLFHGLQREVLAVESCELEDLQSDQREVLCLAQLPGRPQSHQVPKPSGH